MATITKEQRDSRRLWLGAVSLLLVVGLVGVGIAVPEVRWLLLAGAVVLFLVQCFALFGGEGAKVWFTGSEILNYALLALLVPIAAAFVGDFQRAHNWFQDQGYQQAVSAHAAELKRLDDEFAALVESQKQIPLELVALREREATTRNDLGDAITSLARLHEMLERPSEYPNIRIECERIAFSLDAMNQTNFDIAGIGQTDQPESLLDLQRQQCAGYSPVTPLLFDKHEDIDRLNSGLISIGAEMAQLGLDLESIPGRIEDNRTTHAERKSNPPPQPTELTEEQLKDALKNIDTITFIVIPLIVLAGFIQKVGQHTNSMLYPD